MNLVIDQGLKAALKPEIARLNQILESLAKETPGFLGELLSYILINSGKRVRPSLVHLGASLGESNIHEVRQIAMVVELIHIATLVHDDVIDNAALRRGRKTVAHQEGVDTAVLLGDHVYTLAFQKAAELGRPLILKLLAQSTSIMCHGEIDQLKERYEFSLTEKKYFSFIHKKTASLFGASARAGAILANQNSQIQAALESYGHNLGMAFQITDDLLDLTGDEMVVGKTLRTDLVNGKITLPLIHFRDQLTSLQDEKQFLGHLRNPNGHLADLIKNIYEAGSVAYAERVAAGFIEKALQNLDSLPAGETKNHFQMLAEMLSQRKA